MKKISLIFIFIALFFLIFPQGVQANKILTPAEKTALIEKIKQQIEILTYEIQLLQSLILNFHSNQKISAGSYLAMDLSDNSIILSKNTQKLYPIASITKLMTAVISLENIEKEKTITLTKKMLTPIGFSPCLYAGLEISAENLLKAALIQSSNDAAEALSYFLGKDKFLKLMNQKAKELGMKNTYFVDSTGLNPANRSTAADLAKLIAYIYEKHPEILEITKENDFWLPDAKGWLMKFRNVNNFYPLPNFLGGKTGYLVEAKQTLAAVFQIKEKPIAIILLYSNNRQADLFNLLKQLEK